MSLNLHRDELSSHIIFGLCSEGIPERLQALHQQLMDQEERLNRLRSAEENVGKKIAELEEGKVQEIRELRTQIAKRRVEVCSLLSS